MRSQFNNAQQQRNAMGFLVGTVQSVTGSDLTVLIDGNATAIHAIASYINPAINDRVTVIQIRGRQYIASPLFAPVIPTVHGLVEQPTSQFQGGSTHTGIGTSAVVVNTLTIAAVSYARFVLVTGACLLTGSVSTGICNCAFTSSGSLFNTVIQRVISQTSGTIGAVGYLLPASTSDSINTQINGQTSGQTWSTTNDTRFNWLNVNLFPIS